MCYTMFDIDQSWYYMLIMRGYQGTHPSTSHSHHQLQLLWIQWTIDRELELHLLTLHSSLLFSRAVKCVPGSNRISKLSPQYRNSNSNRTTHHTTGLRLPNIEYLILSPQRSIKLPTAVLIRHRWCKLLFNGSQCWALWINFSF